MQDPSRRWCHVYFFDAWKRDLAPEFGLSRHADHHGGAAGLAPFVGRIENGMVLMGNGLHANGGTGLPELAIITGELSEGSLVMH